LFKRYAFLTLAAAASLTACTEVSSIVEPDGPAFAKTPAHRVTGNGVAQYEEYTLRAFVNVSEDKGGSIDVTTGEGSEKASFTGRAECLSVAGNTAWITAVVTKTTDATLVPLGTRYLVVVVDGGEVDQVFGDFAPEGVSCTDQPAAPMLNLTSGRFLVS
jgi:hypothetical protein